MSRTLFSAPPGSHELVIEHVFDAPIDLVFKMWTDPAHIPQWWGPARLVTTVEQMEVRDGGSYRNTQRDTDGSLHGFRGVYHTVKAPHLIIATFEYDGYPDHVALESYSFTAQGEQTHYRSVSVFQSLADRDGMVQSGCEMGVRETMERMAKLLQQHRKTT